MKNSTKNKNGSNFVEVKNTEKIEVLQLIKKIHEKIISHPDKAAVILSLWINKLKKEK